MRRKAQFSILQLSIAALAIVSVFLGLFMLTSPQLFSIIGEEGFEAYDPLLQVDSFDQGKWLLLSGTCYGVGTGMNNFLTQQMQEECNTAPLYDGISASNGDLTHSGKRYYSTGMGSTIRTDDLRLKDFKTTIVFNKERDQECFYSSKGPLYCGGADSSLYELTWNNYLLGEFQVKKDGVVVQEGTVNENEEFYLYTKPHIQWSGDSAVFQGHARWENPRIKEVFGCDANVAAGSVKAYKIFNTPQTITLSSLDGFERFCPDDSQTLNGENRNQVIYSLVTGEAVQVQEGETWVFTYVADADALGVSESCDLFDVDREECTGTVFLCDDSQEYVSGLGCVALQETVEDLSAPETSVSGGTLEFSTFGVWDGREWENRRNSLKSGTSTIAQFSDVVIDESACPYSGAKQSYPEDELPRSCFSIETLGKEFIDGSQHKINDGLTVELESLRVEYKQSDGSGKQYSYNALWKFKFSEDAIQASDLTVPSFVKRSSNQKATVLLQNNLASSVALNNLVRFDITSVGGVENDFVPIVLDESRELVFPLESSSLGEVGVTFTPVLTTEFGSVSFDSASVTYTVNEDGGEGENSSNDEKPSIIQRLVNWVSELWKSFLEVFK